MAVVTWTNMKGYTTGVSGDEMDERTRERYDRAFDERSEKWAGGFRRLCRMYSLPEDNVLLYGISGGAQMAHRLALRNPDHFMAVHIHVNSSYDVPTEEGADLLWLVSTGTLEYGYPAAQRFYEQALDRGYHMIFKAQENIGHSDSPEIRRLSRVFFEFCLGFVPDASDPEWEPPPEELFYFMRYPVYVGDWYNQMAFPADRAEGNVPPEFMVSLPTKAVAEAWGTVIEK